MSDDREQRKKATSWIGPMEATPPAPTAPGPECPHCQSRPCVCAPTAPAQGVDHAAAAEVSARILCGAAGWPEWAVLQARSHAALMREVERLSDHGERVCICGPYIGQTSPDCSIHGSTAEVTAYKERISNRSAELREALERAEAAERREGELREALNEAIQLAETISPYSLGTEAVAKLARLKALGEK